MSSPAQYIKQLRESNQALSEGMVKYAETIVALRRELAQAGRANTLDVMDRAYFAGKDAGIAEAEAVADAQSGQEAYGYAKRLAEFIWEKHYKEQSPAWTPLENTLGVLTQIDNMVCGLALAKPEQEQLLPPIDIGVDVTHEGTHVVAFYNKHDSVQEMFYSQFHPLAQLEQEPLGYLCENAAGFKYFRHKKPDKVYRPIALYAAAPPRERVEVTEPDAGALHPKYHYHPTWAIYDAIREGSMSDEQFRHWCNWTAEETIAMVQQGQSPAPPNCHGDRT
jgi:hypothetical protein